MQILILVLLFPLAKCIFPRISFSCFLLGDWGCEIKCNLKCLLLDCVTQNCYCDGWSYCVCNEIYNVGDKTLTNDDFENLDFVELWNNIFKSNDASDIILKQIKKNNELEVVLIKLLRDPYMIGEDIISVLKNKYPNWKIVDSLVSLQHGLKTEVMESGKHIEYDALEAVMDHLIELIEIVQPGEINNSRYRIRVKYLLKKIKKTEDLEELMYLIKLSENRSLYDLVKSSLKNLGYGFEEDGDSPIGKKAILRNISVDIDEVNDDEKLDIAVTKKYMFKNSNSKSPIQLKTTKEDDSLNSFTPDKTTQLLNLNSLSQPMTLNKEISDTFIQDKPTSNSLSQPMTLNKEFSDTFIQEKPTSLPISNSLLQLETIKNETDDTFVYDGENQNFIEKYEPNSLPPNSVPVSHVQYIEVNPYPWIIPLTQATYNTHSYENLNDGYDKMGNLVIGNSMVDGGQETSSNTQGSSLNFMEIDANKNIISTNTDSLPLNKYGFTINGSVFLANKDVPTNNIVVQSTNNVQATNNLIQEGTGIPSTNIDIVKGTNDVQSSTNVQAKEKEKKPNRKSTGMLWIN